jgi:branched-chain amino acid transport system ATP-binding protein
MLNVKSLNVFYGDAQALWDVSFHVPEKKLVTIIGSNGAGKSTLLKTISKLIKPRSGEIQISQRVTTGLEAHSVVALGVAHVPEGRQLFPMMTVYENLVTGAILPEAKERRSETIREVYELFPVLADRKKQLASTLSGGEQQMLAIGRGLMLRPRLILLDEPSLGLSPIMVSQIFNIIKEIHNKGISVLLVEQNVQRSLEMADQGFVLENGRITMQGAGGDLLANDHIRTAYLGL